MCVVFRRLKLLFVFLCLYRINSVTSLPLLSQDPAYLGTEDLNTLGQGYTLTVPRAPLILQAFSMSSVSLPHPPQPTISVRIPLHRVQSSYQGMTLARYQAQAYP